MTAPAQVVKGRSDVLQKARASRENAQERSIPAPSVPEIDPRNPPYALREYLEHPEILVPPPALIPNLAWAGRAAMISGREKSGKSTLVGQGVAAFSRGGEFLGEPIEKGRTLWYAIDEDAGDTVRRLQAFGADPDSLYIQTERPTAQQMDDEMESTDCDLVIIDILPELYSGLITSSRTSDEVLPFLKRYITIGRERDVGLLFLHHSTKSGAEYRDSTAIGGVMDAVLNLRQRGIKSEAEGAEFEEVGADDGRRMLSGKGRGGINVKVRLAFDGSRYCLGSTPMPPRARILLELSKGEASGSTLASALRLQKDTILVELRELQSEGLVRKSGQGPRTAFELTASGSLSLSVPAEIPYTKAPEPIAMDELHI